MNGVAGMEVGMGYGGGLGEDIVVGMVAVMIWPGIGSRETLEVEGDQRQHLKYSELAFRDSPWGRQASTPGRVTFQLSCPKRPQGLSNPC